MGLTQEFPITKQSWIWPWLKTRRIKIPPHNHAPGTVQPNDEALHAWPHQSILASNIRDTEFLQASKSYSPAFPTVKKFGGGGEVAGLFNQTRSYKVGPGEKVQQKFSSTGERAPG